MKKIVGITMGDPAGIGPEIAIKTLNKQALYDRCRPLLIGDESVLKYYLEKHPELALAINVVKKPNEGKFTFGTIDLIDLAVVNMKDLPIGEVSKVGGNAAFQYVKKVIELAMAKEVDATVTNPLNKEAMNAAGHHYAGHTEIYADLTGRREFAGCACFDSCFLKRSLRSCHKRTGFRCDSNCESSLQKFRNR